MTAPWWLPILPAVTVAALYTRGVHRLRARGDAWQPGRTVFFFTGDAMALAAVLPPLADPPTFPLHMVQHLLLAMAAPLALALSAPFTLALRTLPPPPRTVLLKLLHSRAAAVAMWGPLVLVLEVGGMYAYYATGLFALTEQLPWLHLLVHAHMFATGCLFSWYLVGKDPTRHRPSTTVKVIVLVLAAGSHDVLAKLMYALALPAGQAPLNQLRTGSELLFYGGDAIDLLLMTAVLAGWYTRTGRELARQQRRTTPALHRHTG